MYLPLFGKRRAKATVVVKPPPQKDPLSWRNAGKGLIGVMISDAHTGSAVDIVLEVQSMVATILMSNSEVSAAHVPQAIRRREASRGSAQACRVKKWPGSSNGV